VRPAHFSGPALGQLTFRAGSTTNVKTVITNEPPVMAKAWAPVYRRVIGIDFLAAVFSEVFSSML
jgi:hypothetical protein